MKAIVFAAPGGAEVLHLADAPAPEHGPDDLLVDVYATAVNRADVLQREGKYPPPPGASEILGLEMAGVVRAVGSNVSAWQVGDRVCALLAGGGYAEQVVIPAALALPVPEALSLIEAAALPEVWTTAYDNLFNWGRLQPGETVLIHGGGSGIGTAAIQLARHKGCTVLVTAGSAEKLARCQELGAAAGFNYREGDWAEAVLAHTEQRGVDVILDIIGAAYLAANLRALAIEGRLVIIGTQGGVKTELDLRPMLRKRLSVMATTLRARPVAAKAALAQQMRAEVLPGFISGAFKPQIDRVLPLAEAGAAHQQLEASTHFGKIVLQVRQD